MTVGEAKAVAREWAAQRAQELPDVAGACLYGSICRRRNEEPFPSPSDVDIYVAVRGTAHDILKEVDGEYRGQEIEYRGLCLEVGYPSISDFHDLEAVLGNHELAPAFKTDNVLLDPTGVLTKLGGPVRASYAEEKWVRARCASLEQFARWGLDHAAHLDAPLPGWSDQFAERVVWLLLPGFAGISGVPSVAALGGPTFRRSLVNCRTVLEAHGMHAIFGKLLEVAGASGVTKQQAAEALAEMETAFEQAVGCMRTRFWSGYLFQAFVREKLIGGARGLIHEGFHREATLFLAVIRSMAQNVFENDAPPPVRGERREGHRRLLAMLGIESGDDISRRAQEMGKLLPEIMAAGEKIIATSPDVVHA